MVTSTLADNATAAFLFTDIEGSTRLWQQHGGRMHAALQRHDALLRAAIEGHGGRVVKSTGDGVHAVFDDAAQALRAMVALQLALNEAPSASTDASATQPLGDAQAPVLRVRCGLHVGEAYARDGDVYGPEVNRAARIMDAAHGGQMLLSAAAAAAAAGALGSGIGLRDLGLVRLRDLQGAQRLHQVLAPSLRADFPPLRSLEATPNNLPPQLDSFVGRDEAQAEVARLLSAHRLVTLTGAGGIGKTRLSLQVAARQLDAFSDGVWFVDLAPLAEPAFIAQTLAAVLGVREEAGGSVADAVLHYLGKRQVLVLLDNCEHMVEACAVFARRLLAAGPGVKVLASSRELLRLTGEQVFQVPALSVPEPAAGDASGGVAGGVDGGIVGDVAPAAAYGDAVQLFVDRARAAQPAFRVDAASQRAVVQICGHLDGLPLAIELAAARTRALPVHTIAERIVDRFRLLGRADRTRLPRQQTLRALIDWSHELLGDAERALLRRASVFAGGCTLEAAEAVLAFGGIAPEDVVELLGALVDKSLLLFDVAAARYRLLDTVREYAAEQLAAAGETATAQRQHLQYGVALAERARPELAGPGQAQWLARLDAERGNLLAALAFATRPAAAVDSADAAAGDDANAAAGSAALRLSYALRPYWLTRGLPRLGLELTQRALAQPAAQQRNLARCRGLFDAGALNYFMGQYAAARSSLEASLEIATELGDARWMAGVLQLLGMACLGADDDAAASRHLEQGLRLAERQQEPREIAAACNPLAQLHRLRGRRELAAPLYARMVELSRGLQDRELSSIGLLNLAMLCVDAADAAQARGLLREVFEIGDALASVPIRQCGLDVAAALAASQGDWPLAAHSFAAAQAQVARSGLERDPTDAAFVQRWLAQARGALGEAAFAERSAEGTATPFDEAVRTLRRWL